LPLFKQPEAQRTHGDQLPLKLPMGFRRGEHLKQVWQLHPVTHDGISNFVTQVFADIQTIVGMEEYPQHVSDTQESMRQRLDNAQGEERKKG
jgi:hypothetical protein